MQDEERLSQAESDLLPSDANVDSAINVDVDSDVYVDSNMDSDAIVDVDVDSSDNASQIDRDSDSLVERSEQSQTQLSKEKLDAFNAKIKRSGVIYLSRIPPFMKPIKVRQLLAKYGQIGRIYLAPEDPSVTKKRIKYRGNKRQNYTEGWVEFTDKSVARSVAKLLNGTSTHTLSLFNNHRRDYRWEKAHALPRRYLEHEIPAQIQMA